MGADQSQIVESLTERNYVTFMINGTRYMVDPAKHKVTAGTKLVDFIRDHAFLKGTKYMCREGGCGACTVTVKTRNPLTGQEIIRAVNSCLVPVFACDGWEIMTVEFLGNRMEGYHPIQQKLVKCHGTQCGFCTPGWVMNFYSMMESKKQFTIADVQERIDGNICRCTGYRPILDAVKSLATDASEELIRKCDSQGCSSCPLRANSPVAKVSGNSGFEQVELPSVVHLSMGSDAQWVKAIDMNTLFMAIQKFQNFGIKYRIVGGNTGMGVYKKDGPYKGYVELNTIPALMKVDISETSVILGGAVTISQAIEALEKASSMNGFEYCKHVCKHWKRVANISIRNTGTLAGNLMLKHEHMDFPSDIFLVLETIGAMLTIASSPSLQKMWTVEEFLKLNMEGKIIYSVHLPPIKEMQFRSFKISRRYQNAHAYVNAGFLMQIDPMNMYVKTRPRIVFGGMHKEFVHATMTEEFLMGKSLSIQTMQGAMETLEREVNPDMRPPDGAPMYRKKLAQALFYKFMLEVLGDKVSARMKSGSTDLERGPAYGKQMYDTDKSEWPMYEPVAKLEAPFQCSGEAEYINDICPASGEIHGALVTAKFSNCMLKSVDPSAALEMAGVIAWVDYKNIPGLNNYMLGYGNEEDVVFVKDKIRYAGEAIGMILAESREIAHRAVPLVRVDYENRQKPILDIASALQKFEKEGKRAECVLEAGKPEVKLSAAPHNVSGEFRTGGQYHLHMETHVSICVPKEDGMDVFSATQNMDFTQFAVANTLGVPCNMVNVHVRRLGGGFGGKINRANHIAAMCAVAANTVRRPVRMNLDLEGNMDLVGGRSPYLLKYQMGFDDTGKIMNLNLELTGDTGCSGNEETAILAGLSVQNIYAANSWSSSAKFIRTDLPPNVYCRSPGYPKGIALIEYVVEHIAFYLKKDPMEVRLINLMQKGDPFFPPNPPVPSSSTKLEEDNLVPKMLEELNTSADIAARQMFIARFNQEHRWKKRGFSIMPVRFPIHYIFSDYPVHISVFGRDGSVAVVHGGIEMGQGINTKVAQVVARKLQIPMSKVQVKSTNSTTCANAAPTNTSVTSEKLCYAAHKACAILNERLAPVKAKMENPTWEKLVMEARGVGVDLTCSSTTTYQDALMPYHMWCMAASEVEIDCLTGEYKIVRSDVLIDAGDSLSPDIDIGQTEGSFIMGLGWLLTEKMEYDSETGQLLTNRTWNYKPPLAKDIPEDFRVSFMKNRPNQHGVMRTKTLGESPLVLAFSVFLALKHAIASARMDAGNNEWFQMDAPVTPEDIQRLCLTDATQFSI